MKSGPKKTEETPSTSYCLDCPVFLHLEYLFQSFLAFGFGVSINSIFKVNFNIKIINI